MTDVFRADEIAHTIEQVLGFSHGARDWMQMNRNLFSALKLEKTMMFLLLVLITIVASFNMVDSRFAGWIAELDADFVGRRVARGSRIALLDSPDLYAAEADYLVARETARRLLASELPEVRRGADDLVLAARRRLELANIPEARRAEPDRPRVARRTSEIVAPAAGVVTEKMVVRGQRIEPGMPLVTLVDRSPVWVEADLYEADAALARVGQRATLQLTYDAAFRAESSIAFLYPELEPETRTLRARFDVANRDELLRPGMLVEVTLELGELAGVAVPDAASCRARCRRS